VDPLLRQSLEALGLPVIRFCRQWYWHRRLNRLVARRARSFEVEQYRRRREAALRHEPREWVL
jgi:hypothetical protein